MQQSTPSNALPRFPTVFFARYQVWQLSPVEIDEMLANGWFRSGLHVHTSTARFVENAWRPSLMVRIPLANFCWKKRLRKTVRRNSQRFSVHIRPFEPRPETERLWQNFKKNIHQWGYVPDLTHHLFRGNTHIASFNTLEVAVFDRQKLVAFSLFDEGANSIASLEAAYDPAYKKYSLGIFTMLLEIEYCEKREKHFYYPGFYPKGVPMFDYKLRPGFAQFYRPKEEKWVPWQRLQEDDWLLDEVLVRLRDARSLMQSYGYKCSVKIFNGTNFPGVVPSVTDYNILLAEDVPADADPAVSLRIAWDPLKETYLLFSKEISLSTVAGFKTGNAKTSSFGPPFYFDSFHRDLSSLEDRIEKIVAKEG